MTDQVLFFKQQDSNELGVALQLPAHLSLSQEAVQTFQQGLARLEAAEPAAAIELFTRTVELAPKFPEARTCLGLAYALTYNIYPAFDQLEIAGKLDPENFAAHFTLAKLNFKMRIPQRGYDAAKQALKCVTTIEQRKMLAELLKEERARERNGIARPAYNKPYSRAGLFVAGSGLAAAIVALLLHVRW